MINTPDSINQVIEQVGYLERGFRGKLRNTFGYRSAANKRWFEGKIGETKTFSRPQALSAKTNALNPANNTGLDNGLTISNRYFEQWIAQLDKYADALNLNVEENETLIANVFIDDYAELGHGAALTMDSLAAIAMHTAYESGDTYVIAADADTVSIHVDNTIGFDTQYNSLIGFGLPNPVSPTNKIPVILLDGTTGAFKAAANVIGVAVDATNISSGQTIGGIAFNTSGVLTLDAAITAAIGDRLVAMDTTASKTAFNPLYKDGATVLRPNNRGTRAALLNTDALTFDMIYQAKTLLGRRGVPKFRNGCYVATVDETIMGGLYDDPRFQFATQGTYNSSPIFQNGVISRSLGVEFVPATTVPAYAMANGTGVVRHGIVYGDEALEEHPWIGVKGAQNQIAGLTDSFDIRYVDDVQILVQAPLTRLADVVKMSYKYIGAFTCGTDKSSGPAQVPTSDFARFKRAVELEVGSAN